MDDSAAAAWFRLQAQGKNTRRTYQASVKQYEHWCSERGLEPLPGAPEQVAAFLAHLAKMQLAPSTIRTRFAGLRWYFRQALGNNNATSSEVVVDVLHGICRALAKPQRRASAMTANDLRAIIRKLPRLEGKLTLQALRDRALLLVVYAGALRRSEAVGLLRDDLVFEDDGVLLLLRSSKTDQGKEGRRVGIGYGKRALTCPVRSLQAWLEASPDGLPWVFAPVSRWGVVEAAPLAPRRVSLIVKRLCESVNLDPKTFSAHSLRAGCVTDLNSRGVSTAMVQAHSRHKSANMVNRYHRPASVLAANYTRKAGL